MMFTKVYPLWKSFSKNQLIKVIRTLRNPKVDVLEVWDKSDRSKLTQQFDKMIQKGQFSVIFLRSRLQAMISIGSKPRHCNSVRAANRV